MDTFPSRASHHRTSRVARSCRTFVTFAWLVLFLCTSRFAHADFLKPSAQFRFGTSSSPFETSTAVGDLDSDAKPDYAIADRLGRSSHGYEYSLELALSLEKSRVFHFHSTQSALTVSVLDLDSDQDLDIVLTQTLGGEIVGVWINNGHGEFSERAMKDFPQFLVTTHTTVARQHVRAPSVMATLTFRRYASFPARSISPWPLGVANTDVAESWELCPQFLILSGSIPARAPPILHL